MKFCTSYRQKPELLHKATQIRYSPSRIDIALDWMKDNPTAQVIVEIVHLEMSNLTEKQIYDLAETYPNLYFDFYRLDDFKEMHRVAPIQKYMYHYPITSWTDLNYILHFDSLCSITIGEPLIFDIDQVKTLVKRINNKITLRAWPTIGRPAKYEDYPGNHGLCHFWVLPQHSYLYDDYIDIFDIIDEDTDRERVLCNYYFDNKPWLLNIEDFFRHMDTNIPGYYVADEWAQKRVTCGQRCFRPSPTCYYCEDHNILYDLVRTHPELLEQKTTN